MHYIVIVIVLFIFELAYFKIADRFNIIDKPNHRSSHSSLTLRGGGIIFLIAMFIACILGYVSLVFTMAVLLVGIVSFIDDIKPLPQLPRFSSHLIAVLLVLYDLDILSNNLLWLPILLVLAIGWINAFNFMDGINGITVLYSLTSILTFSYLYIEKPSFNLLMVMGLACLVFGFFNVRKKAKTFAGDVGSISMAVFLMYFMIKIIFETGQIGYLLFFSVYGIDAVITIIYRIKNKENIFLPHRSHLYQYLANELKWSHIIVSSFYAVIQLIINFSIIFLIKQGYTSVWIFIAGAFLLMVCYMLIRISAKKKILLQNG
ncbi:putative undecaprenyl-phosphate N-acetylglucosaminyl 1-phosphate transferase [compost metagenome]